jgi:DNA mismatch repair protein MutS
MSLTPMMQQYREAKERHPGTLLLFRMGDFYELFYDDAEVAARVLNLTLTSRDKQIPMAGFPHHSLEFHLRKLLRAGHRVAICEQVEDPAEAKGLVKREVIRVVTAGTLTEDALLDPRQANHLAAVVFQGDTAGVAWVELSAGHFHAADLPADRLLDELARLEVAECLWPETQPADAFAALKVMVPHAVLTTRPAWTFDPQTAREALRQHFHVRTLQGFGFDDEQPCLRAAGALVLYLQETLKADLRHLGRIRPYRPAQVLFLDTVTRRSLELTRTLREGRRDGSLLAAIDRTVTAMGARLLHDSLLAPLTDRAAIEARLDAVEELKNQLAFRRELRELLGQAHDLARLATRASTGRASPRDLAAVAATLRLLPAVKAAITARKSALLNQLERRLELCAELRAAIETALVDDPPLSPREGDLIRPGYHPELDRLRDLSRGGKEWIARFQAQEITRTGIPSLKVGFNKVFGYYIEVTHTHQHKIPPDYHRKQTLKNTERYITPELKTYEEQVLRAEEQSRALEYELFVKLREQVAAQAGRLLQTAEVLSALDVLAALAELADARNYCRPELADEPVLEIVQGRHPVLEQLLPAGTFVPNDTAMGPGVGTVLLVTGPNMSGKSSYIRQVALITILAHLGSFVPAQRARIGLADRVFTRVGAGDDLARGQSTFLVEMTETANILNNATAKSLVILDEIGRGTSTYDGVALAWAITEHLHDRIGCRTLFATHYHELTQLAETLPGLRNYNALVREDEGQVIFLHQIAPGAADRSYGIHVAQLAGVPRAVLQRARQVLHQLENQHDASAEAARQTRRTRRRSPAQPSLFGDEEDAPPPS